MTDPNAKREVSLTVPAIIWPVAVITSAVLAILEATGVAHVPWYVCLIPIAAVIALSLAVVVLVLFGGLLIVGVIAAVESIQSASRRRAVRPKKAKIRSIR